MSKDNGGPAFPCDGGRTVMSGNAMHKTLPSDGMKLYAAPVSEAKAQGVVMPERLKPSRYELHDAAVDAWNSCLDEVARLNAAPVQQVSVPQCVLDWFEAKQAHVTAVDAYNARLAFVREHMPFGTSVDPEYQIMEAADRKARSLVGPMFSGLRDLAAAPEAPEADAGCVLEQAMYTLISIGYHENSGLVHELRQALAAHRAKGDSHDQ